ncbi:MULTISPECIES: hypothetical protein [Pseudoalteromonas]|uniref:Uncharacterized protein n=1 Tax=Pseudoalteromonas amylolytica TaxID=1859457 RepID=A0A1S1MSI4_9GAMM|nr:MULTISPECIES: hypothetical protein [Pseudoalteromonas]OHU84966.1 hypothetical protein BFC16_19955 [Pseudoalteromonas sp. JW3]OHU90083.1 hypothetical protein BET10_15020 [Pseudoalteromonas amylolytica]
MFTLFRLTLEHSYFADNQWRNAQLQASPSTQHWLNRYQMSLHQEDSSWCLYGNQNTSKDDFLHYLSHNQEVAALEFWILQPLSEFVTFTDLPMDWKGILLLDSSKTAPSSDGQEAVLLTNSASQGALQGGFVKQAIAKVVFNISDLMRTEHYRLSLLARSTQWVYHFIQRGQTRLSHPQLIDKLNEVSFSKPHAYTTQDGEVAWLSDSKEFNLPLKQVPEPRFELVDTQHLDKVGEHYIKRTVISALPAPRCDQLFLGTQQDFNEMSSMRVQSHMYVYF